MRVKIDATAELLYSISSCIIALIVSYLLEIQTAKKVFLIIGIVFGIIIAIILFENSDIHVKIHKPMT